MDRHTPDLQTAVRQLDNVRKLRRRLPRGYKGLKDRGALGFVVTALLAVGLALVGSAVAGIVAGERAEVVFEKDKVPEGATWSPKLTLTEEGLVSPQLEPKHSVEVWIQTQKIPPGLSWRPPSAVRMTLSAFGAAPGGFPLDAYVRYGCDGVHWSTWYSMPASEAPAEGALSTYVYDLRLPQAAREKYQALMKEWWETDPDWTSDEDAFCRWLVEKEPDFFAHEFPFVGYVQFRLEHWGLHDQVKVKSLSAEMSWGVGGLSSIPKSGKQPPMGEKWHFDVGETQQKTP